MEVVDTISSQFTEKAFALSYFTSKAKHVVIFAAYKRVR